MAAKMAAPQPAVPGSGFRQWSLAVVSGSGLRQWSQAVVPGSGFRQEHLAVVVLGVGLGNAAALNCSGIILLTVFELDRGFNPSYSFMLHHLQGHNDDWAGDQGPRVHFHGVLDFGVLAVVYGFKLPFALDCLEITVGQLPAEAVRLVFQVVNSVLAGLGDEHLGLEQAFDVNIVALLL